MMRAAFLGLLLVACGGGRRTVEEPEANEAEPEATRPDGPRFAQCDGQSIAPDDPSRVLASIERTGCMGWCPTYIAVVFRDGLVQYKGRQYVMSCEGIHHLDAKQIAELDRMFADADYLGLADEYVEYQVTDNPYVTTTYSPMPGTVKRIRHYMGDRTAPRELSELEEGFDQLIDIERFIGSDRDRDAAWRTRMQSD